MRKFLQALVKIEKPTVNLLNEVLVSIKNIAGRANLKVFSCFGGFKITNNESVIVIVQFGGRRDFYGTIEMLTKETVDYRVIITSSNVKSMKIKEIKWILNDKYQTKDKWLIIDIEHKESPKTINFMLYGLNRAQSNEKAPRRKKIYGERGTHKEQD